jgi:membrane associated rhomboid family serine protease
MSSGADLFVVCKQCGAEVSPYITECPYCGGRLRRRAPKLPRVGAPQGKERERRPRGAAKARGMRSLGESRFGGDRSELARPYATIALVAATAVVWVLARAEPETYVELPVAGPLGGDWWRLFTHEFLYFPKTGMYAFVATGAVALFGWLLERRHGPFAVLVVFFAAAVTGALVALAVYEVPIVGGANAAALGLIGAWAAPDLSALRTGAAYEGDLIGTAAFAALLLALPFALQIQEASWLAGAVGGVVGLVLGVGMHARGEPAS